MSEQIKGSAVKRKMADLGISYVYDRAGQSVPSRKRFAVNLKHNGRNIYGGFYADPASAAAAANTFAEIYGAKHRNAPSAIVALADWWKDHSVRFDKTQAELKLAGRNGGLSRKNGRKRFI